MRSSSRATWPEHPPSLRPRAPSWRRCPAPCPRSRSVRPSTGKCAASSLPTPRPQRHHQPQRCLGHRCLASILNERSSTHSLPYETRTRSRCGKRCAYSRPGRASPPCYPQQVCVEQGVDPVDPGRAVPGPRERPPPRPEQHGAVPHIHSGILPRCPSIVRRHGIPRCPRRGTSASAVSEESRPRSGPTRRPWSSELRP